MVAPIENIAQAIQQANRAYLDGLPGITLDGADKIIASLRKKVAPFAQPTTPLQVPRVRRSEADEMREDAIMVLIQMGLKRFEAQRGVDQLLAARDDIVSVQDVVTESQGRRVDGGQSPLARSPARGPRISAGVG